MKTLYLRVCARAEDRTNLDGRKSCVTAARRGRRSNHTGSTRDDLRIDLCVGRPHDTSRIGFTFETSFTPFGTTRSTLLPAPPPRNSGSENPRQWCRSRGGIESLSLSHRTDGRMDFIALRHRGQFQSRRNAEGRKRVYTQARFRVGYRVSRVQPASGRPLAAQRRSRSVARLPGDGLPLKLVMSLAANGSSIRRAHGPCRSWSYFHSPPSRLETRDPESRRRTNLRDHDVASPLLGAQHRPSTSLSRSC